MVGKIAIDPIIFGNQFRVITAHMGILIHEHSV
jgi:hypothetical protein